MTSNNSEEGILHTLYTNLKEYSLLHFEVLRIEGTEKLATLLSSFIFFLISLQLFSALLIFLTFQFAYWLASLFNSLQFAILIVIGVYALLFWGFCANRKHLFFNPIRRYLVKKLSFSSKNYTHAPYSSTEEQREFLRYQILKRQSSLRSTFNELLTPSAPTSPLDFFSTAIKCGSTLIKGIRQGYNFIKNR